MRDFVADTKRRIGVMLVFIFALSACLGPIAHAQLGEAYGSVEPSTSIEVGHQEHGHSHDDDHQGLGGEKHFHDHNSADHSHETPGLTAFLFNQFDPTLFDAFARTSDHFLTQSPYQIDRPPRV